MPSFIRGGKQFWRPIKKAIIVVLVALIVLGGVKAKELFFQLDGRHQKIVLTTVAVIALIGVLIAMLAPRVAKWVRSKRKVDKYNATARPA